MAAERGELELAQALLEYAQRWAPADSGITLAIADVRLRLGDPGAAELFDRLAREHDVLDAWFGLAASRLAAGDPASAAADLSHALAEHASDSGPGMLAFFDAVAAGSGAPGWCGLSGDGVLTVATVGAGPPRAALDGKPIRLRRSGNRLTGRLPAGWRSRTALTVEQGGIALIGSPIHPAVVGRVEGMVATRDGGVEGWIRLPAAPHARPQVIVYGRDMHGVRIRSRPNFLVGDGALSPLPRGAQRFCLTREALAGAVGALEVLGPDGRNLLGSPIDPHAERRAEAAAARFVSALFPFPVVSGHGRQGPGNRAAWVCPRKHASGTAVIIPVHSRAGETLACLEAVLGTVGGADRVIVVDDASPEPELVGALARLARSGRIELVRRRVRRGFPAAANAGLRAAAGGDAVLLNSDTLVAAGWLEGLRAAAHAAADIGTATPFSNDATILSYPAMGRANPLPDAAEAGRLAGLAARVNAGVVVEIPTAVGFCMYIRGACLAEVGLFREDAFAQGYGEENDFCLRARALGWRHVAAAGVYVAHVGAASYGAAAKAHLVGRNLAVLNRLHPGYDALIAAHAAADPLAAARRRLDAARWREAGGRGGAAILVTHDQGGGVQRRVAERCAALRDAGRRPIVLRPDGADMCRVGEAPDDERFPNLRYRLPGELPDLAELLRPDVPEFAELHQFLGHHSGLLDWLHQLKISIDVVVHDYSWLCGRINLIGPGARFCGEPPLGTCRACIADLGSRIGEPFDPEAQWLRSAGWLATARRVIVPSRDAAVRIGRHFPGRTVEIEPWEDEDMLPSDPLLPPGSSPEVRVAVAGAIGIEKGFELLLGCVRDAVSRKLPLAFVVVGYTSDDFRLLDAGPVTITGPYEHEEAADLLRAQRANIGFLPSIWPETWCYALTDMWRSGLNVAVLDIGAPAERVRRTGRGWVLPLAASPRLINNTLLACAALQTAQLQVVGQCRVAD